MVQLKRKVTLRTKETVEPKPQPATLQKDPKPSSGQGKWWIAMAVVLLLVGLGVYFYRHNASTAEKAVAEAAVGSTQGVNTAQTTSKAGESNEASAPAQSAAGQVQTKEAKAGQASATAQGAAPAAVKAGASETPASVAQTSAKVAPPTAKEAAAQQTAAGKQSTMPQTAKSASAQATQMPAAVQPAAATSMEALKGSVEQVAHEVIRGEFGNGRERMDKLGARYTEVQRRVNQIYRAHRAR